MLAIYRKEIGQYFSSLTGYMAMVVFLLLMGLFLFVFPNSSLLDFGYATLDKFFELAPWVLLLLVPAITMRSFADEFKSGTWELLATKPVSLHKVIVGKYLAALAVAVFALIPTIIYLITIYKLSPSGAIDFGGILGSYISLILLTALFTAVGIFCSSISNNAVISFILAAFVCFLIYIGFNALSQIPALQGKYDYYLQQLGVEAHYNNMSRGLITLQDVLYFVVIIGLFLLLTKRNILNRF